MPPRARRPKTSSEQTTAQFVREEAPDKEPPAPLYTAPPPSSAASIGWTYGAWAAAVVLLLVCIGLVADNAGLRAQLDDAAAVARHFNCRTVDSVLQCYYDGGGQLVLGPQQGVSPSTHGDTLVINMNILFALPGLRILGNGTHFEIQHDNRQTIGRYRGDLGHTDVGGGDAFQAFGADFVAAQPRGSVFLVGQPVGEIIGNSWSVTSKVLLDARFVLYTATHLRLPTLSGRLLSDGDALYFFSTNAAFPRLIVGEASDDEIQAEYGQGTQVLATGTVKTARVSYATNLNCINNRESPLFDPATNRSLLLLTYDTSPGAWGASSDYAKTPLPNNECRPARDWSLALRPVLEQQLLEQGYTGSTDLVPLFASANFKVDASACVGATAADDVNVFRFKFYTATDTACEALAPQRTIDARLATCACSSKAQLICGSYQWLG